MDYTAGNSTGIEKTPTDTLAQLVREYYREAEEAKRQKIEEWNNASDYYNAVYPEQVGPALSSAKKYEIFIQLTKRLTDNARAQLLADLLKAGEIPFAITLPQYQGDDPQQERKKIREESARRMEAKIRDIFQKTDYLTTLESIIGDLTLLGTGITKNPVLKKIDYPVFTSPNGTDPNLYKIESRMESELVPTSIRVSPRHIFPSPGAKNVDECDYIIHKSVLTARQLTDLGFSDYGYDIKAIQQALKYKKRNSDDGFRWDDTEDPNKEQENSHHTVTKKFELLEFWGKVSVDQLAGYIPEIQQQDGKYFLSPEEEAPDLTREAEGHTDGKDLTPLTEYLNVVVSVVGEKTIRAAISPLENKLPFNFAYWRRNPDSIWGDGIAFSLKDYQRLMNIFYAQIIEGKSISAKPQVIKRENSFLGDDTTLEGGKQWIVRGNKPLQDALTFFSVPDVTDGLINMIQLIERESTLSTISPVGMGESARYQTQTARGMMLLNENQKKDIQSVIRSLSSLITNDVKGIYHWLMADSDDPLIKGDYNAQCTGYLDYMHRTVYKSQLLEMSQIIAQNPAYLQGTKVQKVLRQLFDATGLTPDDFTYNEQEFKKIQESQMQSQLQMQQSMIQMQTQLQMQMEEFKALLKEKQDASADERKRITEERLVDKKAGRILRNNPIDNESILQQEQQAREIEQSIIQEEQQMAQMEELEDQKILEESLERVN